MRRLGAADRRLLLGYGPLVGIVVAFVLMAVLAPTVAPEQNVVAGGGSAGPAAGTVVPGRPASGTQSVVTTPGTPGRAGTKPPGVVAACGQQPQQIPSDPYSPPCVSFTGDNGGATSQGVTASTITVTYRIPADPVQNYESAIQQLASKYGKSQFVDTAADVTRTLVDIVAYFNTHFQLYGRKIRLVQYQGQGQLTQEILGGGQAAANADGIKAGEQLKAFADISALSQPYAEALSNQKVVNIGAPYMSQQWFANRSPYAWSLEPDCTQLAQVYAEVADKELLNQPAAYAGGSLQGKPRRVALIAPDNPEYQQCVAAGEATIRQAGGHIADTISYSLDIASLSSQAASIVAKLKSENITSVACACDPILPIFMTAKADQQDYVPEWLVLGTALTDYDPIAQLYDQREWAHAFGGSALGDQQAFGSSFGYFAAKSVDPANAPAHVVDLLYYQVYLLAIGLQMAGPNLTPQTFMQGMLAYPGGSGPAGIWKFGTGEFTPQRAARLLWWDPNRISIVDGQPGAYVPASGYYRLGEFPTGAPPVFPHGVQQPGSNQGVTQPPSGP